MQVEVLSSKGRLRREGSIHEDQQTPVLSPDQSSTARPHVSPKAASSGGCSLLRVFILVVLATCVVSLFLFMDEEHRTRIAIAFEENKTGSGMVVFFFVAILAIACLVPGPIVAASSGALYGTFTGATLVWTAATLSQSLTYVLGKYLFRDFLVAFISKRFKAFSTIDNAIAQQGWKLVFLVRLAPIFPDSVLNYALATTAVPYVPYITASSAAILPWIILFTYMGSVTKDIAAASKGEITMDTTWVFSFAAISVIACIIFGYLIAMIAKKALSDVMKERTLQNP